MTVVVGAILGPKIAPEFGITPSHFPSKPFTAVGRSTRPSAAPRMASVNAAFDASWAWEQAYICLLSGAAVSMPLWFC